MDEDKGKSWSLAAVQDLSSWGTELYIAYRQYKLDRPGNDFDSVNSVMTGAQLKF